MASFDEGRAEEIARWRRKLEGWPVRFEKVERGDEQILEDREPRELDGVPSLLALPDEPG